MKLRPGDIALNLNPKIGVGRYSKDTYTNQSLPSTPVEEPVLEIEEPKTTPESKSIKDELQYKRMAKNSPA